MNCFCLEIFSEIFILSNGFEEHKIRIARTPDEITLSALVQNNSIERGSSLVYRRNTFVDRYCLQLVLIGVSIYQ